MTSNPVRWFEIYVQDMDRARRFYETVFDATLQRLNSPAIEMWAFPQAMGQPGCSGALVRMPGAVDQFLDGRYVVDESCHHAAGPGAGVHVALQHDAGIDARDLLDDVLELEVAAERLLLLKQPVHRGVAQHTLGVAQRRITSRVSSSVAATIASLTFSCTGASLVAMKRVPMLMPSAPSASAATSERPSAMPPDATNGIFSSSAARGSRMKLGTSSSPG